MSTAAERREEPCAILTQKQVAEWLQVRPRQLERLGIPCLDLGHKTKRYLMEDVLTWLDTQRRARSYRRGTGYTDRRSRDVAINVPIASRHNKEDSS